MAAIACFLLLASLVAGRQLLPMAVAEDGQNKKLAGTQTTSSSAVGLPIDTKTLIHYCASCYLQHCPTEACREYCFCPG
jgi:hypothetical protein